MDYAEEPIYPDPMRGSEQSYTNQTPNDLPTGLSKREYFAGLAMQAIIPDWKITRDVERKVVAELAVKMSDELLKQLENTK